VLFLKITQVHGLQPTPPPAHCMVVVNIFHKKLLPSFKVVINVTILGHKRIKSKLGYLSTIFLF